MPIFWKYCRKIIAETMHVYSVGLIIDCLLLLKGIVAIKYNQIVILHTIAIYVHFSKVFMAKGHS